MGKRKIFKKDDFMTCRRSFHTAELRAQEDKEPAHEGTDPKVTHSVSGHAAVFNRQADICGWFGETIMPGAFDDTDFSDVPLFLNHNSRDLPLARSRNNNGNSTMTLTVDDIGLAIDAELDTDNNPSARALYSAVERGDITGMSFAFHVAEATWEDLDTDYPVRKINRIDKVFDVSAVNEPAYEDTDISARDKEALENAKSTLENARSKHALDSGNELELLKEKNRNLMY